MRPELSEEIERFEEKYAENPDSLVFARLADLYRKTGEADRALDVLEDGLRRHPDYLSAHIVRARCLRDLGRDGAAERAFERVLEQDEQNLVAVRSLAELARERGDVVEAERWYEELLALDPHNDEALSFLGEAPDGGGEPEETPDGGEPEEAPLAADDDLAWPDGGASGPEEETVKAGASPGPDDARPEDELAGPSPSEPGTGGEEDEEGGPWWRRGGTSPEPDAPADDTEVDPEEEGPPAGVGQTDVFRLAEPEEERAAGADDSALRPSRSPSEAPEPASEEEAEFLGLDEEADADAGRPETEVDGGLPAEDELSERIREIADTEVRADEAGEDGEDLLTETLAELYESQGFHREAAEMYEELLEDRPDDDELRARLGAARSAMDAAPSTGEQADTASETEDAADEGGTSPERRASAREHFRALLRGEARGPVASEEPDPRP